MALGSSTFIAQDPTIYNDNSELSNLKLYVLRKLGWPLIRVEMTEDQLVDCILDAVSVYHEWAAMDYNVEIVTPVGNKVTLPDHIRSKFVVDVLFERDYFDTLSGGLGAMGYEESLGGVVPYDMSGKSQLTQNFDIAQYYLYMQHMEDFKKLVGVKKSFGIFNGDIHLYPQGVRHSRVGIVYKPMADESYAEQSMWIKKYSVAGAKIVVGTIRSKLGGFSSTGTNIAVDGGEMKSEGREDIVALEESIKTMGVPMPIIQG